MQNENSIEYMSMVKCCIYINCSVNIVIDICLVKWKRCTKHMEASCLDLLSISFRPNSDSDFSPILSQTLLVFFGNVLSGPKAVYVIILPERNDAVCCSVRSPSLNVISQVIVISTNQKLQRLFHCLSKGD